MVRCVCGVDGSRQWIAVVVSRLPRCRIDVGTAEEGTEQTGRQLVSQTAN